MVITAKYAGRCTRCGQAISAGESIDWVRGGSTTHAKCPAARTGQPTTQRATSTQRSKAATRRCWECGCEFTFAQAKTQDGDWRESYCGC